MPKPKHPCSFCGAREWYENPDSPIININSGVYSCVACGAVVVQGDV